MSIFAFLLYKHILLDFKNVQQLYKSKYMKLCLKDR